MMVRFPGHQTVSLKAKSVWCSASGEARKAPIVVPVRTMEDVMAARPAAAPHCAACGQVAEA